MGTVRSRIHRARTQLRGSLERAEAERSAAESLTPVRLAAPRRPPMRFPTARSRRCRRIGPSAGIVGG